MTNDEINSLTGKEYELRFAVKQSICYHQMRHDFLDRVALFLLWAVGVGALFHHVWWVVGLGICAIVAQRTANRYGELKNMFIALEHCLDTGPAPNINSDAWVKYKMRKLEIEIQEPPMYYMLAALSHNMTMVALGFSEDDKHYIPMTKFQKFTCQLFRWTGSSVPCNK